MKDMGINEQIKAVVTPGSSACEGRAEDREWSKNKFYPGQWLRERTTRVRTGSTSHSQPTRFQASCQSQRGICRRVTALRPAGYHRRNMAMLYLGQIFAPSGPDRLPNPSGKWGRFPNIDDFRFDFVGVDRVQTFRSYTITCFRVLYDILGPGVAEAGQIHTKRRDTVCPIFWCGFSPACGTGIAALTYFRH